MDKKFWKKKKRVGLVPTLSYNGFRILSMLRANWRRLYEPLRVATPSAKLLGRLTALETVRDIPCSFRAEDISYIIIKYIAERNHTVAVKTTWHDSAVRKYSELIGEAVAEEIFSLDILILFLKSNKFAIVPLFKQSP